MLQAGQAAPGFDLPDAEMEAVSLAGFKNRKIVVLYFYPKDDTPGCTLEAIEFSDMQEDFARLGAVVIGVSMDDCAEPRLVSRQARPGGSTAGGRGRRGMQ